MERHPLTDEGIFLNRSADTRSGETPGDHPLGETRGDWRTPATLKRSHSKFPDRGLDLAGVSEFAEADDPQLHAYLVSHIREMIGSPLDRVRDLGICYEIASAFPAFANHLWSLLEDDRRESRLNVYRLNGSGISLRQLGDDAPSRVAKWLPERRAEFVREIGDNADN